MRNARLTQYVQDYLKTHSCVDCGESDPAVLDFDHRNPEEKEISISKILHRALAMQRLLDEIAKCDVRCANCHRRRHAQDKSTHRRNHKMPVPLSKEIREKIRQSKLGKPRSEETKQKLSAALKGHHFTPIIDLTGKIFGRLSVICQGPKLKNRIHWHCWCACGESKLVSGIKLTTGKTKSCGCLRHEFQGNQFTKDF